MMVLVPMGGVICVLPTASVHSALLVLGFASGSSYLHFAEDFSWKYCYFDFALQSFLLQIMRWFHFFADAIVELSVLHSTFGCEVGVIRVVY